MCSSRGMTIPRNRSDMTSELTVRWLHVACNPLPGREYEWPGSRMWVGIFSQHGPTAARTEAMYFPSEAFSAGL